MNVGEKNNGIELLLRDTGKRHRDCVISLFRCHCGKEFEWKYSDVKRGIKKNCDCFYNTEYDNNNSLVKILDVFKGKKEDNYQKRCKCLCNCGNIFITNFNKVKKGVIKSCNKCHNIKDIRGFKIGKLLVLDKSKEKKYNVTAWRCLCDCGNIVNVSRNVLVKNNNASCGCSKRLDYVGKKIGMVTVLSLGVKKGNKLTFNCKCDCGKVWSVRNDSLKNIKSCGCFLDNVIKSASSRSGCKSPNWNKNLTEEDRVSRRYKSNDLFFRKNVFKRDNYSCYICKKRGKINAHHLNGYHWCKNERYDINNGITLCSNRKGGCHYKFHSIYGIKWNTIYQFVQFLRNKSISVPDFILERCI